MIEKLASLIKSKSLLKIAELSLFCISRGSVSKVHRLGGQV